MVEVHSEIHYVRLGEGWEEVVVRNVLHYTPLKTIMSSAIKTTGTLIVILGV